jgi:hypothetical protein
MLSAFFDQNTSILCRLTTGLCLRYPCRIVRTLSSKAHKLTPFLLTTVVLCGERVKF